MTDLGVGAGDTRRRPHPSSIASMPAVRPLAQRWITSLVALALPLVTTLVALTGRPAHAATGAALVCSPALAPGQPAPDEPWPQSRYDLATVHRLSQGAGVTVAVLDSGVDPNHPQLAGAVRGGGDLLDGSTDGREDCVGHGTAVASIIAARPVPGIAFRGVAPQATVLSIRVGDRRVTEDGYVGTGDVSALVAGIQAAVAARPRPAVLNLSISTTTDSPALRNAIQAALDADIVVVAAVGNLAERGNPTPYPAAYDGVVGVGAIGSAGLRYGPSQIGRYVDLVAPGEQVLAASPLAGHVAVSGTSFAVPFVAGTAALIRARWPHLDRTEVVRRLLATADPPAGGQPSLEYGYGVVNPLRALTEVVPPAAPAGPAPTVEPVLDAAGLAADPATGPSGRVLAVAAALLLAAVAVAALAMVTPAGRRRGWRPGRLDPTPPPSDDGSGLFDHLPSSLNGPPSPPARSSLTAR
jgi:type VII secretion-associated serine protease mycosin